MTNSWLSGIRMKILLLFFVSLGLSVVTVFTLLLLAIAFGYFQIEPIASLMRYWERTFGIPVTLLGAGFVLFILYVFLLSRKHVRYIVEISGALQHVAKGSFDPNIPIRTNDELGALAENINKMSAQLKASLEEERRAVQTKNELITNVSHDLRTPLTSVTGYLGLIEQDRYKDEVELRYYVNIAYDKAQRLGLLIQDLFEYTRASSGGLKLNMAEINLQELLGQLAAQFSLQLQNAGMESRLDFPEQKVIVRADGEKLMRVFENLLSNAIMYGKDSHFIDIVIQTYEDTASVRIINYGEPIPAADIPHIFERFYRVEKSRSDQTGGSGLGLAIVKSIVELHGGAIRAESDVQSTSFEVLLPVSQTGK